MRRTVIISLGTEPHDTGVIERETGAILLT